MQGEIFKDKSAIKQVGGSVFIHNEKLSGSQQWQKQQVS
jgi:hypothetical protein